LGAAICWDQWFPETARIMALKGAEMLFYPTAIGSEPPPAPLVDSRDHWRRVMQGHAAANYVPVVAANRIGPEQGQAGELCFYGSSFITSPTGEIVSELGRDEEGVILARFDLAQIAKARASWGLFRDRRPDLYGPLLTADGGRHLIAGIGHRRAHMLGTEADADQTRAECASETGNRFQQFHRQRRLGFARVSASTRLITRF
jgi:N-carbamoylputrescine amidase